MSKIDTQKAYDTAVDGDFTLIASALDHADADTYPDPEDEELLSAAFILYAIYKLLQGSTKTNVVTAAKATFQAYTLDITNESVWNLLETAGVTYFNIQDDVIAAFLIWKGIFP